ncbi:MAG: DUF2634 domain-containing protein [Lachnospiraceae bacterium]
MFPFDIEDEEIVEEEEEQIPCEYGIDFETGQLSGRMVYGLDALKVWIWIALGIDRYYYEQYSWDNGHELATLIGKATSAEDAVRMITECLTQNEHILGIKDVDIEKEDEKFTIKFTVSTDLGDIEEVILSV